MQPEPPLENDTQQRWKRRYYATLEELETKERQWRELERLLRQLVTRLTLAADSRSEQLNAQLRELRNAIRDGKDVLSLRPLIDEVGQTIIELDKQRRDPGEAHQPGRWLQALLEAYPVPKPLQRQVRQLNKRLAALSLDDDPQPVVDELAPLFAAIIREQASQEPPTPADEAPGPSAQDASTSPRRGLLQNLFGSPRGEATPGCESSPTPSHADEADQLEPKARKLVAPAVGELLLQLALRLPDRVKRRLDLAMMRRISAKAKQRKDLMPLVDALAHHVEAAYQDIDTGKPVALDETSLQSVHAALLVLVDELQTPDDLSAEVERLRRQLSDPELQPDLLVDTLHRLADIVGELCARLGAQYREVEGFLRQLTDRLQEMDQGLRQSAQINHARHSSEVQLGSALDEHMRELNAQVEHARDLQTLKGQVQGRLESIGEHLRQFQQSAAGFDEQARQQIDALQGRVSELEQEGAVLKQALAEHRELALQDALTKLANRQAYDERIRQELARARRYGSRLSIVVWDVDHFKTVNDNYGHTAGDKVLKVLAETLAHHTRETDFIARYGGEEFVMLLPETDLEQAREVADKLRGTIAEMPFHFRNVPVNITLSAGISTYTESDSEQSLFERADQALYRAKQQGRNRVCVGEGAD